MQDEWELISKLIKVIHDNFEVPVTAKMRIFEDIQKTVDYAKMMESAGCQILTVHGRTREQKGALTGLASWNHIKAVVEALKIPVIANGNVGYIELLTYYNTPKYSPLPKYKYNIAFLCRFKIFLMLIDVSKQLELQGLCQQKVI